MLSPRCGLSLEAKKCDLGLGVGLMDVSVSASYSLASSPRFLRVLSQTECTGKFVTC